MTLSAHISVVLHHNSVSNCCSTVTLFPTNTASQNSEITSLKISDSSAATINSTTFQSTASNSSSSQRKAPFRSIYTRLRAEDDQNEGTFFSMRQLLKLQTTSATSFFRLCRASSSRSLKGTVTSSTWAHSTVCRSLLSHLSRKSTYVHIFRRFYRA